MSITIRRASPRDAAAYARFMTRVGNDDVCVKKTVP